MRVKYLITVMMVSLFAAPAGWASDGPSSDGVVSLAISHAPTTTQEALRAAEPATGEHAMVATAQHLATDVGVDILKQGGNAVDAAVAIGFAEAVVHPCCGNLGGGGFMTLHLEDGKNVFLDFRETAPAKATADMFQNDQGEVVEGRSTDTYLGTGVPGTVMGLHAALKKYGTMSLQQVMAPAIKLARDGFVLQQGDVDILDKRIEDFARHDNVAAIFLNDGKPWQAGETLVQPQLAKTLELISRQGVDAFYKGPIAKAIVKASKAHGGILTLDDFADYQVRWDKPVTCNYRGYHIVSAPPPSSGGVVMCQILEMAEPWPLHQWGYASTRHVHYMAEAERRAFADRNTYLGDPDFVDNPIDELLSPVHIDKMRKSIQTGRATPSADITGSLGAPGGNNTTSYAVVDEKGNAVSVTYTINYLFGNGLIAGDTGFFLNNEMDDFTSKPGVPNSYGLVQGEKNKVEPGKRPLSSMSPTLVFDSAGDLFMATGSPGGSTIITTVMQSIQNVVDFGMNVQQAVNAPRMHQQWYPEEVRIDRGFLTQKTRKTLEDMGYTFNQTAPWGADEAIVVNPATGILEGANDRRRPAGLAAGY